jgi:uncharacterized membrane protein YebE (DUF533 family)
VPPEPPLARIVYDRRSDRTANGGRVDLNLDAEQLIGSVIKSTLFGRGKRAHGVGRLVSRRGGLLNGTTLLALAGVAWGLYETATSQQGQAQAGGSPPTIPSSGQGSPAAGSGASALPPLPQAAVPGEAPATAAAQASSASPAVPEGVRRVVQLTLSAARADGTLSEVERERILAQAREAGVEGLVAAELEQAVPLPQIVAGVTDAAQRADLYTLAFAITRADEQVTGGERVYLAQLAHLLGLSPEDTSRLESEAAARIDAERAAGGQDDVNQRGGESG